MKRKIANLFSVLCLAALLTMTAVTRSDALDLYVSAGQSQAYVGREFSVTATVSSDAAAWVYDIDWSGPVELTGGRTDGISGTEGDSHSYTWTFRGTGVGTATFRVTAPAGGLCDANYAPSKSACSDSTSVQIVSVSSGGGNSGGGSSGSSSEGSSGGGGSYGDTSDSRNSNTALVSLGVSAGTLSPAFDPAVTEYTVDLPSKTTTLTVTAEASDSRTTVAGTGEIAVQTGENVIEVTTTAENGDTRTYTIRATVAQAPSVFLDYQQKKLGVVKDISKVTAPVGFTAGTVTIGGESVPCWSSAGGVTLLYLCDEEETGGFYAYTQADGVLGPYQELIIGGKSYIYTGVPSDKRQLPGLVYGTVEVDGRKLDGFTYEDKAVEGCYVLYLTDGDGLAGYYTYDAKEGTLQRYNGAVYTEQALTAKEQQLTQYLYIAAGAAGVLLVLCIVLLVVLGRRKRMVKVLQAKAAMAGSGRATPLETILNGGPEKETAEVVAATESSAANGPESPEAEVQDKPEGGQARKADVPEQVADAVKPEETQTTRERPAEPVSEEQSGAKTPETPDAPVEPDAVTPEETAARKVTLDELLEDIHNM